MSDIHTRAFKLYLMEQDRLPLDPDQQAELGEHLAFCSECRANAQLYRALHIHARRCQQAAPSPPDTQSILDSLRRRARRQRAALPLRLLAWMLVALLALAAVQWIFTDLRPIPAVLPLFNPTPHRTTATPTPPTPGEESGKIPVESLLAGESAGLGIWSPEADYLFIPITEIPIPGSDRRSTRPHFIKASSGEDCPASKTFLGDQGYQNYAWLDGERVLFIDKNGRPYLFTACQDGFEDLGDRFDEPLMRIAMPVNFPELVHSGPLLLEAPSAYWLLDPATLKTQRLANPTPSPDLADSFSWPPTGGQISVLQPVAADSGTSRMFLLDLNTGEVLRSLVIETSDEGRAPLVEWMDANQLFIWGFGTGGPLLVNLSSDPARQNHVLPELFGLDLVYPDQVFSMGAFHASQGGGFHIVIHTNLPDDRSIYFYHSENGQVEKMDGNRQVILILPGDQHMILAPLQDTPPYDDGYELVWLDQPDNSQAQVQVAGHTSRDYPNLASRLLPGGRHILFGSSQGISLVGIPGGETLAFWLLAGSEDYLYPRLYLTPGGQALIVVANPGSSADGQSQSNLLYWIPLELGGSP